MDFVITHFGARPNSGEDTAPPVLAALERCRGQKGSRLIFPKGRYHFYREKALERLLWTSNNDGGIKRIGIPLLSLDGLELDGEGSEFIFHGRMVPLAVWDSSNIRLTRFSIDWDRPFTLEGEVLDQKQDHLDVRMSPATPYVIREGRISGLDDDCYPQRHITLIEYDPRRQELAFDTAYPWGLNCAEEIEPGCVRLKMRGAALKVGRTVLMRMEQRHSPAMSIGRSAEVALCDVAIHAAAGMGLIAQESRDLHLDNLRITPTPNSGRILSTQDDATHFCNCRGHILMENCLFENCWDDGGNIHGIYRVVNQRGPNWVVSDTRHFQQMGTGMGEQDDDLIEFVDPATMRTIHEGRGYEFIVYNPHYTATSLREPLPESVKVGTCIANLSATPDLTIRRCVIRNTRPRGVLINTPGKVVVEENTFHTPGAAVLIGADCNSWYESGAVRDILIRRNVFDNCRFMRETCTPAQVSIIPAIPEAGRGQPFERNIRIEQNTFRAFDPLLVKARSVDGLTFRDNVIVENSDYPPYSGKSGPLDIEDCVNVVIEGNESR